MICATKRRELRKKRFEPEAPEKYKDMNNDITRCMKSKENWIGEQCSQTEENLRKNNSKRAYQLVRKKKLDYWETRESYYYPHSFRKMPHRITRDTEPMERILL